MDKKNSNDITSELNKMASEQTKSKLIHSAKGNLVLAKRAIDEGDIDKALIYLDRGLELEPDNSTLVNFRAKVYAFLKMYKDTLKEVEYLLQLEPENKDALSAKKILDKILDYHKLVTAFPLYS
jgi:tetratricopeptide (TPR) repeat protein